MLAVAGVGWVSPRGGEQWPSMTTAPADIRTLLVGGYTPPMGTGHGIRLIVHDLVRATLHDHGLVAVTESPSFLVSAPAGLVSAPAGGVVYAVNETDAGRVSAFRVTGAGAHCDLEQFSVQSTGGAHPCHLAVHQRLRLLAVANYTSGSVSIHPLGADGRIEPLTQLIELTGGGGPDAERQEGPHAHQVTFFDLDAAGVGLAVADLGSDRVWRYRHEDGRFASLPLLELPAGSGTRQLLVVGGRALVLGELDGSLAVADWTDNPRLLSVGPGHAGTLPDPSLAAALLPGPRPELFYATHRGGDIVSLLRLDGDSVVPVADFDAAGRWPRHACLAGDQLYLANQLSDAVVSLPVDPATGLPSGPPISVEVPGPSCVLAL